MADLVELLNQLDLLGEGAVSQREPLDDAQLPNSAGGFVWQVGDMTRLRRFLCLGTDGGTYYAGEKELTVDNAQALVRMIDAGRGAAVLRELVDVSDTGRAAKQNPTLFALALCARYKVHDYANDGAGDDAAKAKAAYFGALQKSAYKAVEKCCRIPTHLFKFVSYCELISKATGVPTGSTGWGRVHSSAIARWYTSREPEHLAMAVTKYQQREGWSNRDLLRLAHPRVGGRRAEGEPNDHDDIFCYVTKGAVALKERRLKRRADDGGQLDEAAEPKAFRLIGAFEEAKASTDVERVVALVEQHGLVREHVPTAMLNKPRIWAALLKKMPMTAMMRNLGKMSAVGLLKHDGAALSTVVRQLEDAEQLKRARIHPFNALVAMKVYGDGQGDKGSLKWEAQPAIVDALERAFYSSFKQVEPTGKRFLLALDVSGSMGSRVLGSPLSCRDASAAMAMLPLRTEPHCEVVAFQHKLTPLPIAADWDLKRVVKCISGLSFGATDCALPMLWAKRKGKKFDVFIVYTDNETWFGDTHPAAALREYRASAGGVPDARLVVVAMTATKFSIADPNDAGMLDVAGFDAAAPDVIRQFALGLI